MSFRLKTILLLIFLGLTPYVVTMSVVGNSNRSDLEELLRQDMQSQLDLTVDRLDQSLQVISNDMNFVASLDIMNDVLTGDLDRRIFNLLLLKKNDLDLIGDFDVIDTDGTIVASSDITLIGEPFSGERFMSVPLRSTFDQEKIGELILRYDLENLSRTFLNTESLAYSILLDGERISDGSDFENTLSVRAPLTERPQLGVLLEQNRDTAFALLDNFSRSFYIALAIGIVGIAAISAMLANYLVLPVLQLSQTARLITKTQDYSKRVEVTRKDEIGQLSIAVNSMIMGMQDMIARLKDESENKIKLAQEKHRTETLQELSAKLAKYLSPQIYESIFSGERDVALGSSRKKLTVFFSDIVNFTSTTEHMESEDLTQLLNQYLREMTDIALKYGATVDKYIGDAIMIFFGDPESEGVQEDARKCLDMAIAMQRRVRELQSEWQTIGFTEPFSIRIGIHTGFCTVGNFGTESRMDYTIVGSTVNLASRIESAAEPGGIFLSEDTFLLVRDFIDCSAATALLPKGISKPVQLYRVLLEAHTPDERVIDGGGFQLKYSPGRMTESSKARLLELLRELEEGKS